MNAQESSKAARAALRCVNSPLAMPARRSIHKGPYSHPTSLVRPQTQCHRLQRPLQSGRAPSNRRTMISAPQPGSGPIMERRPDRELPDIRAPLKRWLVTIPIFAALVGASALAIFNYEKANSSVVGATMYSLRTHPRARDILGDEVYFRDRFPWVWGELNQVKGRINIGYGVKGTKASGYMRFRAIRPSRTALFETVEWSLELEDGTVVPLLEGQKSQDPFGKEAQETGRTT